MAIFTIYTYQFSPLTTIQGDLFSEQSGKSLSILHDERHLYLGRFFDKKTKVFSLLEGVKSFECKMLFNRNGVILLRIANEKNNMREIHFEEFKEKNQPSCMVIIDNREEGLQTICIQNRLQAFNHTRRVAQILEKALNSFLSSYRLRLKINAKYFTSEFWNTLSKHPEGIEQVEFHFPYPNMPRISNLVGDMKFLAQQTNSEPMLSLKGQGGESLVINKEMSFIINAVEACAASGHPVFVKPRGMSKIEIGVQNEVREELDDGIFQRIENNDIFDSNFTHILEFLKKIKLFYDE